MSQIYIWQSCGLSKSEARDCFVHVLEQQTAFYNEHLSTCCKFQFTRFHEIFIGQISSDLGLIDWQPWHHREDYGIAWSGVCEDYLGFQGDPVTLRHLVKKVIEQPWHLSDLTGNFSLCAWDFVNGDVAIDTGATQHQDLWKTTGPHGLAIGSRAKPLLELVGRSPQLDEEEASVFLSYKYLLGKGSLYKYVTRISGRQQIRFSQHKPPRQTEYQSLGDYLEPSTVVNFDKAVEICADSLKNRVARQIRFSKNPVLHLTGGRDSRCIAAALYPARFMGSASTGGDKTSLEVRIASQVAKKLGYKHIISEGVNKIDLLALLAESQMRARLWTKISEGVETIRHGLHYRDFFCNQDPFPCSVTQCFNGHHAGLQKPDVVSFSPGRLNKTVGSHLKCHDAVIERFEQVRQYVNMELRQIGMPASRWSELYLWQFDSLQWGQDNLLVKDLFTWYWTPLFDKTLIQIGWYLPEAYQASMRFVEAITLRLAPQLAGIEYDTVHNMSLPTPVERMIALSRRKRRSLLSLNFVRELFNKNGRKALWEGVLLKPFKTDWKQLIDEAYIRKAIEKNYPEEVLWNTATIQLFIETNFVD